MFLARFAASISKEQSGKVWSLREDKYCRLVIWVARIIYKILNLLSLYNWYGDCSYSLKVEDHMATSTKGRDEILKIGEALCL